MARTDGVVANLEQWLVRLELDYVRLACELSEFEQSHDLLLANDVHVRIDQLRGEIARAEFALQLAHKHC